MTTPAQDPVKTQLLDAALMHVAFDGWSEETFKAAIADSGVEPHVARTACPRGAVDLAIAFHKAGDAAMVEAIKAADLSDMKFRDKVAFAVRARIEAIADKEAVRRGTTLFALPHLAADGAKLIWGTCDAIWTTLGDTSEDVNWYTKRATLSGVYSSTVLYWLGDDSLDNQATWEFIDRRIENVMQIEKVKAKVNGNPVLSKLMAGPNMILSKIKAPSAMRAPDDLPGRWTRG
ncbi:COQ9 family protein [Nereida sp. MMG025]|uniref:COQ9 family protein n=1 Tax=Nereida sp. MMG025 TaxID=2909981 RepID=UPI001F01D107|nr:COQ9 family protein [Nereida sp. MMG025]MCF6444314.1 COQ9 family protein [Nereida sp. MMG025]